MKKAIRAAYRFLRPGLVIIGKGIAAVAFVWRMFSYEIRFQDYRMGSQGHKTAYRKLPRWYSPFFWVGLLVWAVLSAIGGIFSAWFELTDTKRVYQWGEYFFDDELQMTEESDRKASLEEYALKNIYAGKQNIR